MKKNGSFGEDDILKGDWLEKWLQLKDEEQAGLKIVRDSESYKGVDILSWLII